jgi:hypothetical protein
MQFGGVFPTNRPSPAVLNRRSVRLLKEAPEANAGAHLHSVIPAQAGIQRFGARAWIPAFAGMTGSIFSTAAQSTLIWMDFCLASSVLGNSICSTPFLNEALTWSAFTVAGRRTERSKLP